MEKGDVVWIHQHGKPETAVEATIDTISDEGFLIALSLHEKPVWVTFKHGFTMHDLTGRIEMLLKRLSNTIPSTKDSKPIGPWIEITNQGHYEIGDRKP